MSSQTSFTRTNHPAPQTLPWLHIVLFTNQKVDFCLNFCTFYHSPHFFPSCCSACCRRQRAPKCPCPWGPGSWLMFPCSIVLNNWLLCFVVFVRHLLAYLAHHHIPQDIHAIHWVYPKVSHSFGRSQIDQERERWGGQLVAYIVIVVWYNNKDCNIRSQASVELHTGPHGPVATCETMFNQDSMSWIGGARNEHILMAVVLMMLNSIKWEHGASKKCPIFLSRTFRLMTWPVRLYNIHGRGTKHHTEVTRKINHLSLSERWQQLNSPTQPLLQDISQLYYECWRYVGKNDYERNIINKISRPAIVNVKEIRMCCTNITIVSSFSAKFKETSWVKGSAFSHEY